MCGIFGIITERGDISAADLTQKALRLLAHRGPDGEGMFRKDGVTLGHRRLAIIDADSGAQPMQSGDSRLCVTYNGEIYNYLELRRELEEAGHTFRTRSDTEVLLAAYSQWGVDCLNRLRGMFAFALADFTRREVLLARDAFGQKPLFYRADGKTLAFSSELPALALLPPLPAPSIDPDAVALYFHYQYIPHPHTIYREVRKLPPGSAMLADFSGTVTRRWTFASFAFAAQPPLPLPELLEQADSVLEEAVRIHTRADVPVGVFLSGGIDSTLVALNLARVLGREVPAFTIAFHEKDFCEQEYAEEAARRIGLRLRVYRLESDGLENLDTILSHYGEPYGDSSVLPTWHVCRAARTEVKVVLSGDGGDELFGGYTAYTQWMQSIGPAALGRALAAGLALHPRRALALLRRWRQAGDAASFWHARMTVFDPASLRRLLSPDLRAARMETDAVARALHSLRDRHASLDVLQSLDIAAYLPGCILPKVDITSMSMGLEVRPPLLDCRVADFAAALPPALRVDAREGGKMLLKRLLLRHGFPPAFVHRRKQGFGLPISHWFLPGGAAREMLQSALHAHGDAAADYMNLREVDNLLARHTLNEDNSAKLWLVLAFILWLSKRHRGGA
jgi:asparagine synthase (glutamine-hydrolysing)